jgi:branched-chain amino acid transport system substrate-binding protein
MRLGISADRGRQAMSQGAPLAKRAIIFACAVAIIISAIFIIRQNAHVDDSFKVGVLTALTGPNASYGRSTREGVDLAAQEINAAGPLKGRLTIIFEDDQMSPKEGVTAFRRLVSSEHPAVVIGPFGSSVVLAVAPIANETQTVIISASATADNIRDAGDFVFRITPPNSKQGADDAQFSYQKLKARTATILFQRNDYGESLRDAFAKKFTELGGQVVAQEGMLGGTTDFRAALTNLAAQKPDVVFVPLHSQEATLALPMPFISADGAMTTELLTGAGPAAEGVYFSTLALGYGVADQAIADFDKAFKAKYGKDADVYAAYYYEVTKIVAQALAAVGNDSKKIRDYLYSLRGDKAYHGITGVTSFDANGEVDKAFYIYQVRNGKFERYADQ